jgi:hypothetical protein
MLKEKIINKFKRLSPMPYEWKTPNIIDTQNDPIDFVIFSVVLFII